MAPNSRSRPASQGCGPTLPFLYPGLPLEPQEAQSSNVNANQRISKISLIRAAWGKDDVKDAQLHKKIQDVRELLAQAGRRGFLKTHARVGYELRVTDDDADFLTFERLVQQADELRQSRPDRDPAVEGQLLRKALRLWRGSPPLSNVPSEAFSRDIARLPSGASTPRPACSSWNSSPADTSK